LLKVEDPKKRRRLAEQVASGELSLVKLREKIEGRPAPVQAPTRSTDEPAQDGAADDELALTPRTASRGAPTDNALVQAKQNLAEALEQLADVLGSNQILDEIGEIDRANLAKYLTIAKLRLENAITVVRSGRATER
jgi:hypothetical protein